RDGGASERRKVLRLALRPGLGLTHGRQVDRETGPAGARFDADGAAVGAHQAMDDRQPEPGAALFGRVEGVEDRCVVWKPWPGILDDHRHVALRVRTAG